MLVMRLIQFGDVGDGDSPMEILMLFLNKEYGSIRICDSID